MSYKSPKYVVCKLHRASVELDTVKMLQHDSTVEVVAWKDNEVHSLVDDIKDVLDVVETKLQSIHEDVHGRRSYIVFKFEGDGDFDIISIQEAVSTAMSWEDESGQTNSPGGLTSPVNVWRWDDICMFEYEIYY